MLSKAIPSFVNDIKSMIKKDNQKLKRVLKILENWLKQLDESM